MRLVVQVPCLNEEETLGRVLDSIPTTVPGVDEIVVVVIDDGCTDRTVEVARSHGVTEFVTHAQTRGLGRSFHDGVQRALALGADILVNTDGDNQYPQERIADLVQPIVRGQADLVIADRQVRDIEHFSVTKKLLQRVGSAMVNRAAGTHVPDAASGFRAYSRQTLMLLNTITRFSYCVETIIQAGTKRLRVDSIRITTNAKTRESRLFRSTRQHVTRSAFAVIRAFIMYRPYVIFGWLFTLLAVLGLIPCVRFVVLQLVDARPGSHVQSLLLGAILLIMAFVTLLMGVISDLIRTNRTLIEIGLEHSKAIRFPTSADMPLTTDQIWSPPSTVSAPSAPGRPWSPDLAAR